jgi:hypothetical protein
MNLFRICSHFFLSRSFWLVLLSLPFSFAASAFPVFAASSVNVPLDSWAYPALEELELWAD